MKKEDLIIFKNKIVKIRMKNGFFYQGVLLKISNDSITFDDRFDGEMLIDISEINSIMKVDGKKK